MRFLDPSTNLQMKCWAPALGCPTCRIWGEEVLETAGRVLAQLYRICDRKWVPVQNWHAPEPVLDGFKAAMKEIFRKQNEKKTKSDISDLSEGATKSLKQSSWRLQLWPVHQDLTEQLQHRSAEPRTLPTAERLLRHLPQVPWCSAHLAVGMLWDQTFQFFSLKHQLYKQEIWEVVSGYVSCSETVCVSSTVFFCSIGSHWSWFWLFLIAFLSSLNLKKYHDHPTNLLTEAIPFDQRVQLLRARVQVAKEARVDFSVPNGPGWFWNILDATWCNHFGMFWAWFNFLGLLWLDTVFEDG